MREPGTQHEPLQEEDDSVPTVADGDDYWREFSLSRPCCRIYPVVVGACDFCI